MWRKGKRDSKGVAYRSSFRFPVRRSVVEVRRVRVHNGSTTGDEENCIIICGNAVARSSGILPQSLSEQQVFIASTMTDMIDLE